MGLVASVALDPYEPRVVIDVNANGRVGPESGGAQELGGADAVLGVKTQQARSRGFAGAGADAGGVPGRRGGRGG